MKPKYKEIARIIISCKTTDKRVKNIKSWKIFWDINEITIENDGTFSGKIFTRNAKYIPQIWKKNDK